MKVESLDELKAAFDAWRRQKRHAREAVPDDLLERARRAIRAYGLGPIARATRVDRGRLGRGRRVGGSRKRGIASAARLPSFSRVELAAPAATSRPFAEVETPTGLKLRIFAQTPETLDFVSSLCGVGGVR
jgi:hypothetical protein